MTAVYALYSDGQEAQRAVDRLRRAGVADKNITIISNRPMEEFEFSQINGKNGLWSVACLGALIGCIGSTAFLIYTSRQWPMSVGNMKPITWWTFLIPIFELTMYGSIMATVLTFMASAGLLRTRPPLYDPAVSYGQILVGVDDFRTSQPDVGRALRITEYVTVRMMGAPSEEG